MSQTVKYLKDYQVPQYRIPEIRLQFDILDQHTNVCSEMCIEPQTDMDELVLYGSAELFNVALNGIILSPQAYRLEDNRLLLINVPSEPFVLTIRTKLYPNTNTSLMGLYASGGNLYTQCEPEGFRKITYHPDRPDVMSVYTTVIYADKSRYPVLLSNGNQTGSGDLPDNRHWVQWHDPFAKPSYLFALVAGDLTCTHDVFVAADGREIALAFYTRAEDADQTIFALESLKHAMRWDETRFGLVYDLDVYMVVAVSDFNMGAMENKGLNIFNTKYVLADPQTATDSDFDGVESVIAHEYFHNWTGNRVTCRDWFQLSLKEGLTVFRDQEFSADRGGREVRRIANVGLLRQHQFPEDAGPMAHPIRPTEYVEMNNFYTMTVYEKGAEVVRMYHTFLGEEGFQKGMRLYFERHDGQAVTCDDFRAAMADANGFDFEPFALWYNQAGTPILDVSGEWRDTGVFVLHVKQTVPPTPDMVDKKPMMMPLKVALFGMETDSYGEKISFEYDGQVSDEVVLVLREAEQEFVFHGVSGRVVPSLLRGFSAPVKLVYPYSDEDLSLLLSFDDDAFTTWEAAQTLYRRAVAANQQALAKGHDLPKHEALMNAIASVLSADIDPAFKSALLTVPSESELWADADNIDPLTVHFAREALLDNIAQHFHDQIFVLNLQAKALEEESDEEHPYDYVPELASWRTLRNICRSLMLRADGQEQMDYVFEHYDEMAKNMTHEWGLLSAINHCESEQRNELLTRFAEKFSDHDLVMDKYFSLIASSRRHDALVQIRDALNHPKFSWNNPNKVRALVGTFARMNVRHFHAQDGSGYAFVAEAVRIVDRINPQTASGLARAFNLYQNLEPVRRHLMHGYLENLATLPDLSKDTREIVEKILA